MQFEDYLNSLPEEIRLIILRLKEEIREFLAKKGENSRNVLNSEEELRAFLLEQQGESEKKFYEMNISIRCFISDRVSLEELSCVRTDIELSYKTSFVEKMKVIAKNQFCLNAAQIQSYVIKLINTTNNINELDLEGRPALYYFLASFYKDNTILETFLRHGANILMPVKNPEALGLVNYPGSAFYANECDKLDYINSKPTNTRIVNYIPINWLQSKAEWSKSAEMKSQEDFNLLQELYNGVDYLKDMNSIKNNALLLKLCEDYTYALNKLLACMDNDQETLEAIAKWSVEDSASSSAVESPLAEVHTLESFLACLGGSND
ncbi:MAG: hypothetical protein K0Q51_27 [Rickettsiaceae bacterium]|jgi:hypothetical protein|nr:hypothetical protein [Rickettsiaceae bacterium]